MIKIIAVAWCERRAAGQRKEIIIIVKITTKMKNEHYWMRDAPRRAIDSTPWTEAAARTTNCTLGNINGHAVGHDGWKTDVASCRKSLVWGQTERVIFVSRQVTGKRIVEYVPVKRNMRVWKTFRLFLPSFEGGRVHSPTQVGHDEQAVVPGSGDWRQQAHASIQEWRNTGTDWLCCS